MTEPASPHAQTTPYSSAGQSGPRRGSDLAVREQAFYVLQALEAQEPSDPHRIKISDRLNQILNGPLTQEWTAQDRKLLNVLVYGVVRHWYGLTEWMGTLANRSPKKMGPSVKTLIRLGLFQLAYCDGIPDYAALDTTIRLARKLARRAYKAKTKGKTGKEETFTTPSRHDQLSTKTVGFVNGVLRSAQRQLQSEGLPEFKTSAAQTELPQWLTERWAKQSPSLAPDVAQWMKDPEPLALRVNLQKTSLKALQAALQEAGVEAQPLAHPITWNEMTPALSCPSVLTLSHFVGSPTELPGFKEGHWTIQNPSAVAVSHLLDPQPGHRVLDLCAAPGTKTAHIAQLMAGKGGLYGVDSSASRMKWVHQNLERLCGFAHIPSPAPGKSVVVHHTDDFHVETRVDDGRTMGPEISEGSETSDPWPAPRSMDRILIDAPCSGLGTLRKHPEIRLTLTPQELDAYPSLQGALLAHAAPWLAAGGYLVYSTCSIDGAENQGVIQAFLNNHNTFSLVEEYFVTPHGVWDGFYMAKLQRIS